MISLNTQQKLPGTAMVFYTVVGLMLAAIFTGVGFLFHGGAAASCVGVACPLVTSFAGLPLFMFIGFVFLVRFVLYGMLFSFIVSEHSITINSGVILRNSNTIDFSKIQNIDNMRGPLQMLFGLTNVNIWTASMNQISFSNRGGGRSRPEAFLPLTKEDAEWLRNYIAGQTRPAAAVPVVTPPVMPPQA